MSCLPYIIFLEGGGGGGGGAAKIPPPPNESLPLELSSAR